jgi:hypothetical protein
MVQKSNYLLFLFCFVNFGKKVMARGKHTHKSYDRPPRPEVI